MSSGEPTTHYFSTEPGPQPERRVGIVLDGREVEVVTSGGVFSGERLDLGTRVLLRSVPPPPEQGDLLDLGCGWGPVAVSLAWRSPQARVWAVDVNPQALELTRRNGERLAGGRVRAVTPEQVPPELEFAAIWSNPPIRIGKPALHELLLRWLPRLAVGGSAHLVVQRNLGADSLQPWLASALAEQVPGGRFRVSRAASAKGYRVLRVSREPLG